MFVCFRLLCLVNDQFKSVPRSTAKSQFILGLMALVSRKTFAKETVCDPWYPMEALRTSRTYHDLKLCWINNQPIINLFSWPFVSRCWNSFFRGGWLWHNLFLPASSLKRSVEWLSNYKGLTERMIRLGCGRRQKVKITSSDIKTRLPGRLSHHSLAFYDGKVPGFMYSPLREYKSAVSFSFQRLFNRLVWR